jgi:hypothetical protein
MPTSKGREVAEREITSQGKYSGWGWDVGFISVIITRKQIQ